MTLNDSREVPKFEKSQKMQLFSINRLKMTKNKLFSLKIVSFLSLLLIPYLSISQEAPNYSNPDHWAALPTKKDFADGVPDPSLSDNQSSAEIDVFFVHPTSYLRGKAWNADVNDESINTKTDEGAIKHQASVFNGSGKVYAPRYRQAVLRAFYKDSPEGRAAIELAYQDVLSAFDYYLENYNAGRPFVLASHSQGTYHAVRLLKDRIDGTVLQNRLVVAYIPGFGFSADSFSSIQLCKNINQTGCYCAWSTWAKGHTGKFYESFNKGTPTVNPITWSNVLEEESSPDQHLGIVMGKFILKHEGTVKATGKDGIVWVTKPDVPGKMFLLKKNWHIADYNMFWLNIRENVAHRKKLFWKQ